MFKLINIILVGTNIFLRPQIIQRGSTRVIGSMETMPKWRTTAKE